ncbi:TMAO reductase system periplasmic protein TorT [Roseobacter cerasinus]|uniref:TMAO reductase system periplasmic protein TorT n=1 Tax=Roseobacter cerasinus TaxID=2602289 RepID=A0A640VY14_9RHOB|nr:TMAO reductase system periplasmic protein TorT [Roseobacter cerasinus]GFE51845.1 TMAO reductase system periplasmic protein TorT [Roseobacter cerasinus]
MKHSTKFVAAVAIASSQVAFAGMPNWTVTQWEQPFDFGSAASPMNYEALDQASKKWKLCVVFPHLKDPYWVATNYGVVSHAESIGVSVDLFEAGGYGELEEQKRLVKDCAAKGYDAILLGTVSYDAMTSTVVEVSQSVPVFATVNAIEGDGISGMVSVDWTDMGRAAADYFVENYPAGGDAPSVAWLPGPETAGWVIFTDNGFQEVMQNSAAQIADVYYGDTGADVQRALVEEALDANPDLEYIAGNAVAIEAAMGVLRQRGLTDQVNLVADYFTPAMYRGVRRGIVSSAPTDSAALQGVLSVDQAVRHLEGMEYPRHFGPVIFSVTKQNAGDFPVNESLAPADFSPTFKVE